MISTPVVPVALWVLTIVFGLIWLYYYRAYKKARLEYAQSRDRLRAVLSDPETLKGEIPDLGDGLSDLDDLIQKVGRAAKRMAFTGGLVSAATVFAVTSQMLTYAPLPEPEPDCVAGSVFWDSAPGNGVMDPGEQPISTDVLLVDVATGNTVAQMATQNGDYRLCAASESDFRVEVASPPSNTLSSGQSNPSQTFRLRPPGLQSSAAQPLKENFGFLKP
jgi:hypothetical protein